MFGKYDVILCGKETLDGATGQMGSQLAERFGFEVGRVTVRAARTKWGSCSARNDISLSLFLAALPRHLQEFVIIHELCHTVHHNHSAAFHALVDRCLGGRERELEGELKRCRIPIVAEA